MDKKYVWPVIGLVIFILLLASGVLTPSWVVNVAYMVRTGWPWLLGIGLMIIGFVLWAVGAEKDENPYVVAAWTMGIFGLLWIFPGQSIRHFLVLREYQRSMSVETAITHGDGFDPRFVHYDNAFTQIQADMGEYHGTTLTNVTYVGDKWTGIADGQAFKVPLKAVIAYYPNGNIERCEMPGVDVSISGWWSHALVNKVRGENWFVYIETNDVFGDCVDGHGFVYVPFKKLKGLFGVPYPYGLAVIDENGDISMYYNELPESIVGPVYPESIAKAQEDSLDTQTNDWVEWFLGDYGFEETGGEGDPNAENAGQYNLHAIGENENYYVTPLTAKGSSRSLVGITVISVHDFTSGKLSPGVFIKYPEPKTGLRDLADNTKSFYAQWQWVNLEIQEIVPAIGADYVGYVGRPTRLDYVVTYYPDGTMDALRVSPEDQAAPIEVPPSVTPTAPGDIPVDTVNTPEVFNNGQCDVLWSQIDVAVANKDIVLVLKLSADLVAQGCK